MARPYWMTGKTIEDAREGVTINIRQEHIDGAEALNGEKCVAGRCTLQALGATAVWFYRSKAYVAWDDDSPILRYQNSARLIRKVIEVLDDPKRSNTEIEPGLYQLLPPPPGQRLGRDRTPKDKRRKKHLTHRSHHVTGRMTAAKTPA